MMSMMISMININQYLAYSKISSETENVELDLRKSELYNYNKYIYNILFVWLYLMVWDVLLRYTGK